MSDLIDRQQAIDALRKMQTYKLFSGDDMLLIDQAGAMTELMLLPPAEPSLQDWQKIVLRTLISERKTGKWIESNPQNSTTCRLIKCSECGNGYIVGFNVPYEDWTEAHKYCVECGADMREDG